MDIPQLHPHNLSITLRNDWICDLCSFRQKKTETSFYCKDCDFDCCFNCMKLALNKTISLSIHIHPLSLITKERSLCVLCSTGNDDNQKKIWFYCNKCHLNFCFSCIRLVEQEFIYIPNLHQDILKAMIVKRWNCDLCNNNYGKVAPSLSCRKCDFDICFKCVQNFISKTDATIIPCLGNFEDYSKYNEIKTSKTKANYNNQIPMGNSRFGNNNYNDSMNNMNIVSSYISGNNLNHRSRTPKSNLQQTISKSEVLDNSKNSNTIIINNQSNKSNNSKKGENIIEQLSKEIKSLSIDEDQSFIYTFQVDNVSPRGDLFPICTPNRIYGPYSSLNNNKNFIYFGSVPIISGLYQSYCQHFPLSFSPDDFWLLIIQNISHQMEVKFNEIIKNNSFKIKTKNYLNKIFQNKKDSENLIYQLVLELLKKEQEILSLIEPNFTTSSRIIKYITCINLVSTYGKFSPFDLEPYGCGIPNVTLKGSIKDWENILEKIKSIKNLKYKEIYFDKDSFDLWLDEIYEIMVKIAESKKGKTNINFWQEMIKKKIDQKPVELSGKLVNQNMEYITGWITKFFPFDKKGNKNFHREKIFIDDICLLADQILGVKFVVEEINTGNIYELILNSGFLGMEQDQKTKIVSPVIGWFINQNIGQNNNENNNNYMNDYYYDYNEYK